MILTENNQLFACGDNSEGQLGIGCTESQCVPQYIEIEGEEGVLIQQIATGAEHSIILLSNGNAYSCGSNSEGQLGLGEGVKNSPSFTKIPLDKGIKYIACGYYHTVLISVDGEVYIFGDNENQRLGVSDATKHIHIPRLITLPDSIETVHCGNYHTFFKAQNGTVYAVGSNELGQLGLPRSVIEVNNPTEISTDKLFEGHSIKKIACGASHTAFITDNGYLYTCGDPTHQKLCLEETDLSNNNLGATNSSLNQYLPRRVEILEGFIVNKVACGGCHTILTAIKDSTFNNNVDVRSTPVISELPPLQKVPGFIMSRPTLKSNDEEKPPEPPEETIEPVVDHPSDENSNKAEEEKSSIDSLEPNVSGSHILEINDLTTVSSTNTLPDMAVEMNDSNDQILIVEQVMESTETIKTIIKQDTVIETIESTIATKTGGGEIQIEHNITTITSDIKNSAEEAASPIKNMLRVPEGTQHSPDISTKSEVSQKTMKSSNGSQDSENETIICNSEKSSPQATKIVQKTQAVIPILRNDENVMAVETKLIDENDVMHSKLSKSVESEGKISKFFSGLRNESCIGKSRVISSVDIKEQVSTEDATPAPTVTNHTNSRACTII
ncbi:uncharacterized protein LOC143918324 isoform X2 [Arctopsyche grandis]